MLPQIRGLVPALETGDPRHRESSSHPAGHLRLHQPEHDTRSSTNGDAPRVCRPARAQPRGPGPGNDHRRGSTADRSEERAVRRQAGRPGRPEPARHQLRLAARDRLPGHVHAGRLRAGGDRLHAAKNAMHTHEHELHDLCHRHRRLLPGRLRLQFGGFGTIGVCNLGGLAHPQSTCSPWTSAATPGASPAGPASP